MARNQIMLIEVLLGEAKKKRKKSKAIDRYKQNQYISYFKTNGIEI